MDPFRQLFLDQVRVVVAKEVNRETLYELLRLAVPSLTESAVLIESSRTKAFKTLQLRIHPDKHPSGDTTKLFQDVKAFYDRSCRNLCKIPKMKDNPNSPFSADCEFPRDFHVQDKWPFLHIGTLQPKAMGVDDNLTAFSAALCINARGAIAHGQKTELTYKMGDMKNLANVQHIFDSFGGAKQLTSIDEIKQELMENGPVVSTSFILSQAFLSAGEYSKSLLHSRVGKKHELLIVGWKLTAFGEVWLAKSLKNGTDEQPIRIAFRQFGVDDICLAPANSFENKSWQSGPFFDDGNLRLSDGWMSLPGMTLHMDSAELEALARCFSTRFEAAIAQRSPFVIREKNKIARSRRYHLKQVAWDKKKAMWRVRVIKVTDLSNAVTYRKKAGTRAPCFFKRKPGYIFR
jgi:hypothetical protein